MLDLSKELCVINSESNGKFLLEKSLLEQSVTRTKKNCNLGTPLIMSSRTTTLRVLFGIKQMAGDFPLPMYSI